MPWLRAYSTGRSITTEAALFIPWQAYRWKHGIDLLVMGACGHSRIWRVFVGSVTTQMVRSTNEALLLLR